MALRVWLAAAIGLLASGVAIAQAPAKISYEPVVTQHTVKLKAGPLAYTAAIGLVPIMRTDGEGLLGDMSYVAYSIPARHGQVRPVAFVWNGGSGANSTPLHYGAFGPQRLDGRALKPNEATLLDVADLVFIDQIETGFGRYAPDVDEPGGGAAGFLNQEDDARSFARFIEIFLKAHGGVERPTILIGESYGVRRAQLVAGLLVDHGIAPEGLVLISGYPMIAGELDQLSDGEMRIPGYAALAFTRGETDPSAGASAMAVHDAALTWIDGLLEKYRQVEDPAASWPEFSVGLKRFFGFTDERIEAADKTLEREGVKPLLLLLSRQRVQTLFHDQKWASYDIRKDPNDREWISQAIVDDLRTGLGFDPERKYVGQEYDPRLEPKPRRAVPMPPDVIARFRELGLDVPYSPPQLTTSPEAPTDGLALTIVNMQVHFGARWSLAESPMPDLLAEAPKLKVVVAGGIYDDIFPCAVGREASHRDLPNIGERMQHKCYPGGHMMYDDETIGAELSDDVRAFIRSAT